MESSCQTYLEHHSLQEAKTLIKEHFNADAVRAAEKCELAYAKGFFCDVVQHDARSASLIMDWTPPPVALGPLIIEDAFVTNAIPLNAPRGHGSPFSIDIIKSADLTSLCSSPFKQDELKMMDLDTYNKLCEFLLNVEVMDLDKAKPFAFDLLPQTVRILKKNYSLAGHIEIPVTRKDILKPIDFSVTSKSGAESCSPSVPAAPKYSVTASIRGTATVTKTASRTLGGPLSNDNRPAFVPCLSKLKFQYTETVQSGDIVKAVTFDNTPSIVAGVDRPVPKFMPASVDNFVQAGDTVTVNATQDINWPSWLGGNQCPAKLFVLGNRIIAFDRIEHVPLENRTPHASNQNGSVFEFAYDGSIPAGNIDWQYTILINDGANQYTLTELNLQMVRSGQRWLAATDFFCIRRAL